MYISLLITTFRGEIFGFVNKGSIYVESDSNANNERYLYRDGVAVPSPFLTNQRSLPAVKVDYKGTVYTTQILKQQLANELKLPLRDLRVVDPSYPSQIQACFTARPGSILFCIENIKVVLKNDEALIFSPNREEVQEFIPALQQQISQIRANSAAGLISSTGEAARFEHIVIECALNVVCNNLFRRVRVLSPRVTSVLNGLKVDSRGSDVIQTQVDELLPLKNKLDVLCKRVKVIKKSLSDLLENDEDMAMMYLPPIEEMPHSDRKPPVPYDGRRPDKNIVFMENIQGGIIMEGGEGEDEKISLGGDSDGERVSGSLSDGTDTSVAISKEEGVDDSVSGEEVIDTLSLEMLFENYLNEVEWITSEIDECLDKVTNTEENIALSIDLINNRILRFELYLSISSFVITVGALVTGLFGMNLISHLEHSDKMFWSVTAAMGAGMLLIFTSIVRFGRREKLF